MATAKTVSPVAPITPVRKTRKSRSAPLPEPEPTVAPRAAEAPKAIEILCQTDCELHLFDVASNSFIMQDPEVSATVSEVGEWQCEFTATAAVLAASY